MIVELPYFLFAASPVNQHVVPSSMSQKEVCVGNATSSVMDAQDQVLTTALIVILHCEF